MISLTEDDQIANYINLEMDDDGAPIMADQPPVAQTVARNEFKPLPSSTVINIDPLPSPRESSSKQETFVALTETVPTDSIALT